MAIGRRKSQSGFTYMGLLVFVVLAGIALGVVGPVWHTEAQRERENELLFVGDQYAKAIGSYYENTPGSVKQFPASLEDLLEDKRFPVVRRHLRKLYRDPMTDSRAWGLEKSQGRITGVYSLFRGHPLRNTGFPNAWAAFEGAKNYVDWRFVYLPGSKTQAPQSVSAEIDVAPVAAQVRDVAPLPSGISAPAVPPGIPSSETPSESRGGFIGWR